MKRIILFIFLAGCVFYSQAQKITDTATLRAVINADITSNGSGAITAAKLNRILNGQMNVATQYGTGVIKTDTTLTLTGTVYQIKIPNPLDTIPAGISVNIKLNPANGVASDFANYQLTADSAFVYITYAVAPVVTNITYKVLIFPYTANMVGTGGGGGGGGSSAWGGITGTLSVQTDLQAALDAKQATATGAVSAIMASNLTANRALQSDGSGKIVVSPVTSTELNYLSGIGGSLRSLVLQYTDQVLTAASTITMDCSLGYIGEVTLTANDTLAFTNYPTRGSIQIKVKQDGTGGRTLKLPVGSKVAMGFGSGRDINLTPDANAWDILYCWKDTDGNFNWAIIKKLQ